VNLTCFPVFEHLHQFIHPENQPHLVTIWRDHFQLCIMIL